MKPILSILIPTVIGREESFSKLYTKLSELKGNHPIEILYAIDDKRMCIGEKREWLYNEAKGLYSWQIDDDDDISPDAIDLIISHIKENTDCITFREHCTINGQYYSSNHSLRYEKWIDKYDGFDFVRCPFYKDVIKTDIAKSTPFPKIRWNEDEQWSMALRTHLKNEVHIPAELYYYQHISKPEEHNERYGFDRD